jgi:hypothetical protein
MSLPTEVLWEIFGYLTPHGTGVIGHRDYTDILSVRATCRTFRAVSNTLKFWYDDHFCFSNLIWESYIRRLNSDGKKFNGLEFERRTLALFNSLKADKALLATMGRNKEWDFSTVAMLVTVAECMPGFHQNTTAVNIESYHVSDMPEDGDLPHSTNLGIEYLALCLNLTVLSVANNHTNISLNLLSSSCPFLKKLELYTNVGYTGSLRRLRCLEEPVVWDSNLDENGPSRAGMLPIDSASSLHTLNLTYIHGPAKNPYHSTLFSAFTYVYAPPYLRQLLQHPYPSEFCQPSNFRYNYQNRSRYINGQNHQPSQVSDHHLTSDVADLS